MNNIINSIFTVIMKIRTHRYTDWAQPPFDFHIFFYNEEGKSTNFLAWDTHCRVIQIMCYGLNFSFRYFFFCVHALYFYLRAVDVGCFCCCFFFALFNVTIYFKLKAQNFYASVLLEKFIIISFPLTHKTDWQMMKMNYCIFLYDNLQAQWNKFEKLKKFFNVLLAIQITIFAHSGPYKKIYKYSSKSQRNRIQKIKGKSSSFFNNPFPYTVWHTYRETNKKCNKKTIFECFQI